MGPPLVAGPGGGKGGGDSLAPSATDSEGLLGVPVGACLSLFYRAWDLEGADQNTITILRKGYRLPFKDAPRMSVKPLEFPSYSRDSERYKVLQNSVTELKAKHAVEVVPALQVDSGFYSRMFVVPKRNGKWRPIIDLSPLNRYVKCDHFKMETAASVMGAVTPGQWMTSVDLEDAYFHIPIHQRSRRFLRFVFEGEILQFRALCFGLSTAPLVFTTVMRSVITILHKRGVRIHHYLDDWLVVAQSAPEVSQSTNKVLSLAKKLGLRVNLNKSDLVPKTRITYLGVVIDSVQMMAYPSQDRIERFLAVVQGLCSKAAATAWEWLRILGHLSSLEKLVPGGRRRMRPLQFRLKAFWSHNMSKYTKVPWDAHCRNALKWWRLPGILMQGVSLESVPVDHVMYSDASKEGWGAYVEHLQASGLWTAQESLEHINLLELEAVTRGLWCFQEFLRDSTVAVMSDNTTVVSYLSNQGGTRSASLTDKTVALLDWTDSLGITLRSTYVPGRLNVKADSLSRRKQILKTEWSLNPDVFRRICKRFGQPHIDLMATDLNCKLQTYFSPIPDPQSAGVDALLQNWTGLWAYVYPPTALIRQILMKCRREGTELILIAPCWPAQEWFPDLLDLLIAPPQALPATPKLLKQPHLHLFHGNPGTLALHAWRLSPDVYKRRAFRSELPVLSPDTIEHRLKNSITTSGESSAIGATDSRLIHSEPLCL